MARAGAVMDAEAMEEVVRVAAGTEVAAAGRCQEDMAVAMVAVAMVEVAMVGAEGAAVTVEVKAAEATEVALAEVRVEVRVAEAAAAQEEVGAVQSLVDKVVG